MTSAILDDDVEAQQEQDNECCHHVPAESEKETANKSVISGDILEGQKNQPDDDPNVIISVPRD